jgi:hypothetical protein
MILHVIQDRHNPLDYKIVHLQRQNSNPKKKKILAELRQIFTSIVMSNTGSNFWSLKRIITSEIKRNC